MAAIFIFFSMLFGASAQNATNAPLINPNTNAVFLKLQAGADQGEAQAQFDLGICYVKGTNGVVKNFGKAAQYMRKAAEQGHVEAQVMLGSFYGRGRGIPRNLNQAVQWYRKAADQGNAIAELAMGSFYANGTGVEADIKTAIEWWLKSAQQTNVEAQAALGLVYLIPTQGNTNFLNYTEAHRWLRLAAAQHSASAMNNLGVAYENGFGVPMNDAEAARWYQAAAEMGDALGQANLGQLYFDGRGVPHDLILAYYWFKLSANQGNVMGVNGAGNFDSHPLLTPEKRAKAEQMILDFKPKMPALKP